MTLWKIYSMEVEYPGLWQQWYRHQCAAIGFPPDSGHKLYGNTKDGGWCRPVIVECKQGAPTAENLRQLRGYMKLLRNETGRQDVRGILVHGGARKLQREVLKAADIAPRIEIVQYHLQVDFAGSSAG